MPFDCNQAHLELEHDTHENNPTTNPKINSNFFITQHFILNHVISTLDNGSIDFLATLDLYHRIDHIDHFFAV